MYSPRGTVVLMYHGVEEPAPHGESYYTIPRQRFIDQLDLLASRPVAPFELFVEGQAPPASVVITFDDGERSVFSEALPLLRERRMTAAVFVTTSWIGTEGYLTADELCALKEAGWTIGSHGVSHRYLSDLDLRQLRQELVQSQDALAAILGEPPVHLALPGGRGGRGVVAQAHQAGYRSLCTSRIGINENPPDLFRIRRVMMVHDLDQQRFTGIVDHDPQTYLKLQARERVLAAAKGLLGNNRYTRVRAAAFAVASRLRRGSS